MADQANNHQQVMDIGPPTNICHVAHVTYDRFDGFLGLPSEFEPDVPKKAPSASATVFGVSTESMQLSYDSRGNCVPIVLSLLQRRLYDQGGLKVEGIFRITGDNSEEEFVREELNKGVVPEGIDVHCLSGLIKAWFRELPRGILDSLPSEQVMQCESEEDFVKVVRLLPQAEASLLNWAVNLMADIVEYEEVNKMTTRNLALVFAPNMSKMADPLTALMYAVQVMHLLKHLAEKTLRERKIASSQIVPCDESEAEVGDVEEEYNHEEEENKGVDDVNKEVEIIKVEDEVKASNGLHFDKEKKQET
ncbi:Rho GTPase-activating protein 5 [Hirschfeldia incana]|nr:Rho GTPase-activating protein 5 [Hirschfeldia incana]